MVLSLVISQFSKSSLVISHSSLFLPFAAQNGYSFIKKHWKKWTNSPANASANNTARAIRWNGLAHLWACFTSAWARFCFSTKRTRLASRLNWRTYSPCCFAFMAAFAAGELGQIIGREKKALSSRREAEGTTKAKILLKSIVGFRRFSLAFRVEFEFCRFLTSFGMTTFLWI